MVGDSNCTEQYAKDSQSQFRSSSQCLQAEHRQRSLKPPASLTIISKHGFWLSKKTATASVINASQQTKAIKSCNLALSHIVFASELILCPWYDLDPTSRASHPSAAKMSNFCFSWTSMPQRPTNNFWLSSQGNAKPDHWSNACGTASSYGHPSISWFTNFGYRYSYTVRINYTYIFRKKCTWNP